MHEPAANVLWINLCADARNAQDIANIPSMGANFTIRQVDKDRITSAVEEEKPHLICLDYDFPGRQNLQLLRQLRFDYPDIPVIMITVQHSEGLAVWAFRTGARDYLIKPMTGNAIIDKLNNLCVLTKPHTQNQRAPRRNVLEVPPAANGIPLR